jgi:CheY-like chemotaxis protein
LALCAGGLHRKEVAFRLGCSAGTVDTYWRRIFKKTSATSQCEVLAALLTLAATGILERKHAVELASKAETTLISDNAKRDLRPHVRLHSSQYDVLIVEDDQSTRELLAQALGDHGFHVATAANGCEALELLREAAVGVAVLDLVMPVMDGWELAGSISLVPHLAEMPLLFMTAATNVNRPLPGPVFIKPFNLAKLIRAVSLHVTSVQGGRSHCPYAATSR